jgi:transposase InsO family protein
VRDPRGLQIGVHAWEHRAPSDRALSDAWLASRITEIHENARGVYGSRRVQAELRLGQDIVVSRKRIRRLMRQAGISGLVKVKKGRTTIRVPGVRVADDLVERKLLYLVGEGPEGEQHPELARHPARAQCRRERDARIHDHV